MKSSGRIAVVVAVTLLTSAAAHAAHVDFKDPRRALGREDDIKVDAEMIQETLSPGSTICITYQVENLTPSPIAIADKVMAASFDPDSQTVTLELRQWQNLVDLQARLAAYLRSVGQPSDED